MPLPALIQDEDHVFVRGPVPQEQSSKQRAGDAACRAAVAMSFAVAGRRTADGDPRSRRRRPGSLPVGLAADDRSRQFVTDRRAFDSCNLDGEDLTSRPLVERKRSLDELQLIGPA